MLMVVVVPHDHVNEDYVNDCHRDVHRARSYDRWLCVLGCECPRGRPLLCPGGAFVRVFVSSEASSCPGFDNFFE